MSANTFDATAPMVGYLYQLRMALVLLLRRYRSDPGISITIEKYDDVAFHAGTNILQQLQMKHVSGKSLSDSSSDLWKTLRVWCQGVRQRTLDPTSTDLVLLTTAEAPAGSAASYLRLVNRDHRKAAEILEAIAIKSASASNETAYNEFKKLTALKRDQLFRAVYVNDLSPTMSKVPTLLMNELKLVTRSANLAALTSRLEGWWFTVVVEHLLGQRARVTGDQLEMVVDDLREQFRLGNLPIDYAETNVPGDHVFDHRPFVKQLSLIEITDIRRARAILDYYRAVKQRGRWIDEQLIGEKELKDYERKLSEMWEEVFESKVQALAATDGASVGREIYDFLMISKELPLRASCTERFVMRGTYQMLADQIVVGWHPNFKTLLASAGGQ